VPNGLPTSDELTTRRVGAFSLDTSIIEAAAFRFHEGALKQLAGQLPPWLCLWMPDVLEREVKQHRMEAVRRSIQQIKGAQVDLRRFLSGSGGDLPAYMDPDPWLGQAERLFDEQLSSFLHAHNGSILGSGSAPIAKELFDRYFEQKPPFGGGRDKKHEFPDGAALLLLERMAQTKNTMVLTVSGDGGWQAYADQSPNLYCIKTLAELTDLFVSRSPEIVEFSSRVRAYLSLADFHKEVRGLLGTKIHGLPWFLYSEPVARYEVDAQVLDARLDSFEVIPESLRVWSTSADHSACVAEVGVDVDATLDVLAEAYRYKHKFDWETEPSHARFTHPHRFQVALALEFVGDLRVEQPADVLERITVLEQPLRVNVGRVMFGGVDAAKWSQFDDDLPF
jgi:hypothetical protein